MEIRPEDEGPHAADPDEAWQESVYLAWRDVRSGIGGQHRIGNEPNRETANLWCGVYSDSGDRRDGGRLTACISPTTQRARTYSPRASTFPRAPPSIPVAAGREPTRTRRIARVEAAWHDPFSGPSKSRRLTAVARGRKRTQ